MSQDEYGTSWERARDFGEAMLGIPSYADDSMMMVMRYVTKVKVC